MQVANKLAAVCVAIKNNDLTEGGGDTLIAYTCTSVVDPVRLAKTKWHNAQLQISPTHAVPEMQLAHMYANTRQSRYKAGYLPPVCIPTQQGAQNRSSTTWSMCGAYDLTCSICLHSTFQQCVCSHSRWPVTWSTTSAAQVLQAVSELD
eukprot:scpid87708/ scgid35681/ 